MEKRNTLLLTVIAVATLLVAVVGATFAYFASTSDTNNTLNLNATTVGSTASLTATASTFDLRVTSDQMLQGESADNKVANNTTGTLNVTLTSEGAASACEYDIQFAWGSGDTYTPTDDIAGNEFVVSAAFSSTGVATQGTNNIADETQMNTLAAISNVNNGKTADTVTNGIVIDEATISTTAETLSSTATWTYDVKFYNLPQDQTLLANKSFIGTFKVVNVAC